MKHLLGGNILKDEVPSEFSIHIKPWVSIVCCISRSRIHGFRNQVAKGVLATLSNVFNDHCLGGMDLWDEW